jgi:phage-related minor tail protein
MSTVEETVIEEVAIEGEWLPPGNALDVYRPFYTELSVLKQKTLKEVFDYTSKEGLKTAKSYAFKLRKSRKPMKDAHDKAKVDYLDVIRRIDSQYNELDGKLDEIIEIVEAPIKEAEAREAERIDSHQKVIEFIEVLVADALMNSADIAAMQKHLAAVVVDESLEEFQAEAATLHAERTALLQAAYEGAIKREAEEAELAALRAEKAERDKRDHEARIAQEAADKARAEAEAQALREREAAESREKAERARAERAEAETRAAIENAAKAQREAEERTSKAARDTEERIRLEHEKAEADARLEQQRREADLEHRRTVNNEVLADLIQFAGVSEATGKMVIGALFSGRVRHIRLDY